MNQLQRIVAGAATAASLAFVACSGTDGAAISDVPPGAAQGATRIADGRFAVVTAHVDVSLTADFHVFVNGLEQNVLLAPDATFVLRDVPVGRVDIVCSSGGASGSATLEGVTPGETVQVTVRREGNALVVLVTARTPASQPPAAVPSTGGTLDITQSNVCFAMPPGETRRDVVVTGDHVTLVGASSSCNASAHSVLTGTLTVKGNDCSVAEVEITGTVVVTGASVRLQDSCTPCFNDTCVHHPKKDHGKKHEGHDGDGKEGHDGDD